MELLECREDARSAERRRWAERLRQACGQESNLQRLGKGPVGSEGKGREDSEAGIPEDAGRSRPRDRMGSERRHRGICRRERS